MAKNVKSKQEQVEAEEAKQSPKSEAQTAKRATKSAKGTTKGFGAYVKEQVEAGVLGEADIGSAARELFPAASPLWSQRIVARAIRRHAQKVEAAEKADQKAKAKEAKEAEKAAAKAAKDAAKAAK